jgi:CSLREA domain-containing protein
MRPFPQLARAVQGLLVLAMLCAAPTRAATFVVDTTSDASLSACADGVPMDCSLRGAITAANATPAADVIAFDIPTSDAGFQPATQHWRISVPEGPLLPSTGPSVVIDGYTQPGASANTNTPAQGGLNGVLKIEVRGANPNGNANFAFQLDSDSPSVLRGLVINGYRDGQIFMRGIGAHRVEGCYLGTDVTGSSAVLLSGTLPTSNGIVLAGDGEYVIGGTLPAERNLISGLNFAMNTSGNALPAPRIQGNLVGTNAVGDAIVGNSFGLLAFRLGNALIGGNSAEARNVFSGHTGQVLLFRANTPGIFSGTQVLGNYFGTDASGRRRLGNDLQAAGSTIEFSGVGCALGFGGTAEGEPNLIAYSGLAGVAVLGCNGQETSHNHYRGNTGLAFDNAFGNLLGTTVNDVDDADEGGNRLQNSPEVFLPPDFEPMGASSVTLDYRVDTAVANAVYPITVNFYRADCGGGSRALLGSDTIAEAQAQSLRTFTLTAADSANVLPLVATAVDAEGNTSEFSPMQGDPIFRGDFEDQLAAPAPGYCP